MAHSGRLSESSLIRLAAAITAALGLSGCNLIEAVQGSNADLADMVPGGNVSSGELDCWLTLTFEEYPEGVDPRDVKVRFTSIALTEPAEFDWSFIARNDRIADGNDFGSGYRANDATQPHEPPPLGQPLKVRFPLNAKRKIVNAPPTLWLKAQLFWGDEAQDDTRKTIDHVYERERGATF